jgi:hypothetical protein
VQDVVRVMKRVLVFGTVALAAGVLAWIFFGQSNPGGEQPPVVAEIRVEQKPLPAPVGVGNVAPIKIAADAGTHAARVEAKSEKPSNMVVRADAGKATVYFAGLVDSFAKEARLNEAQYQQLADVLYDVQLNWGTTWQTATHEVVHEEFRADSGENIFAESRKAIVSETAERVAKFLNQEQLELYEMKIRGNEPEIAGSLAFVSDAGKVLPSP